MRRFFAIFSRWALVCFIAIFITTLFPNGTFPSIQSYILSIMGIGFFYLAAYQWANDRDRRVRSTLIRGLILASVAALAYFLYRDHANDVMIGAIVMNQLVTLGANIRGVRKSLLSDSNATLSVENGALLGGLVWLLCLETSWFSTLHYSWWISTLCIISVIGYPSLFVIKTWEYLRAAVVTAYRWFMVPI